MMIILTQGFATGFIKNRSSRGDTEIILGSGQNWFYILIIYRFKFNRYIYIYKKKVMAQATAWPWLGHAHARSLASTFMGSTSHPSLVIIDSGIVFRFTFHSSRVQTTHLSYILSWDFFLSISPDIFSILYWFNIYYFKWIII